MEGHETAPGPDELSHLHEAASSADRTASAADRIAASADRQVARSDRRHAALDRQLRVLERHAGRLGSLVLSVGGDDEDALPLLDVPDQAAQRRDEVAEQRDDAAEQRDHAAEQRDAVARLRMAFDKVQDDVGAQLAAFSLPQQATADGGRRLSALDRAQAALDREQAALDQLQVSVEAGHLVEQTRLDRAQAAVYLAQAALQQAQVAAERASATVDELTGVCLRPVGLSRLAAEVARADRTGSSLTVAFIDVDGLKRVNDSRGHLAGDILLRTVGTALRSGLRAYDLVFRFGGDEFVCALADVRADDATDHFDQVRAGLRDLGISLSLGVSEHDPGDSAEALIARADEDMYRDRKARAGELGQSDGAASTPVI